MKPILLHPSLHKHSSLKLLFLLTLISLFSLISLITTTITNRPPPTTPYSPLPQPLLTALLHYTANAANSTATNRFSSTALKSIATVLRQRRHLNFLIFGLSHETLLWKVLNLDGKTVFIDESTFLVSKLEEKHPEIEAYDVSYSNKPTKLQNLIKYARKLSRKECRPVQNLLYSDCHMAITDMPNFVYDTAWDVILVDGPSTLMVGRAAAIFTAGVLARSGGGGGTHVFVHEFEREVERVCSGEFLCMENLIEDKDGLGHFVLGEMGDGEFGFCKNKTLSSLAHE